MDISFRGGCNWLPVALSLQYSFLQAYSPPVSCFTPKGEFIQNENNSQKYLPVLLRGLQVYDCWKETLADNHPEIDCHVSYFKNIFLPRLSEDEV